LPCSDGVPGPQAALAKTLLRFFWQALKPGEGFSVQGFIPNPLNFTTMKTLLLSVLLVALSIVSFSVNSFAGNGGKNRGINYSLTQQQLSPRQFFKGWAAERRDYKMAKSNSFRRMMRRQRGTRLHRWMSRNF
jgi:hypothetical protein